MKVKANQRITKAEFLDIITGMNHISVQTINDVVHITHGVDGVPIVTATYTAGSVDAESLKVIVDDEKPAFEMGEKKSWWQKGCR